MAAAALACVRSGTGPVAQPVFKTGTVVQPTARSVRLWRRSAKPFSGLRGQFPTAITDCEGRLANNALTRSQPPERTGHLDHPLRAALS
jgi:hypothetical protein